MTGKQLKNSILQWAIQGKLVPQDPNDEPASVLLERIRAEKARLVKEGKIKKDKNESIIFRGEDNSYYEKFADGKVVSIDNEIPFEIPDAWKWSRLRSIIQGTSAGKSPNCEKRPKNNDEWGVLTTTAVQYCDFLPDENKVLPTSYNVSEDQKVVYEDLLITRAGPRNRTGIVCVVNKTCDNLILSDKTVRIGYIRDYCNPYYLMYVLNSPTIHDAVMVATVGMADSQVNISQNNIQNILVPIPPYKEQQRIVNKLIDVLPSIKKYSSTKERLNNINANICSLLKKSVLQEAIQGRLVAQDPNDESASILLERIRSEKLQLATDGKLKKCDLTDSFIYKGDDNKYYEKIDAKILDISEEIPFDLPETWEWCRFATIVNYRIGKTPTRGESQYWVSGTIPWVSISDMKDYGILSRTKEAVTEKASSLFGPISPKGTLLMSFKLTVGRTSILEIDAYHNEAIISIWPIVDVIALRNYLFYTLPLLANLGESKDAIKGKTLNSDSINKLLIPLPPTKEQIRIVERIINTFKLL
jgi:type I restriction enzyme S subunit